MSRIIKILRDWLIGFFLNRKSISEPCNLNYIPERLKTNHKRAIDRFYIGELLYRRCDEEEITDPYNKISLVDLSHNRGGKKRNPMSNPNDVLFNIVPDIAKEIYEDKVVCTIKVKDLNNGNRYHKSFVDNGNTARIELIHDPEICMYPHCIFRVYYNDEIVTFDNYKNNLKKANKLRNSLKTELASMVVTKTLSQQA